MCPGVQLLTPQGVGIRFGSLCMEQASWIAPRQRLRQPGRVKRLQLRCQEEYILPQAR